MVVLNQYRSLVRAREENVFLVEVVGPQLVLGVVPEPREFTSTVIIRKDISSE